MKNSGRHQMQTKVNLLGCLLFIFFIMGCANPIPPKQKAEFGSDSISIVHIQTDSLFNSHQKIILLIIPKKALKEHTIDLAYHSSVLQKTSQLGQKKNALAAINGSFFDVENGGSVCYLEIHDSVISLNRTAGLKWAFPDSLINGAIVLNKMNKLIIQSAKTNEFYKDSKEENFVLVSGPLLIENAISQKLANLSFTNNRHPRSCLCITKESIIFIGIDGRSEQADGMSLIELQTYLQSLNCIDALNLDGGGSSTLWTKTQGILNSPSDKTGERVVANAIVILKKDKYEN